MSRSAGALIESEKNRKRELVRLIAQRVFNGEYISTFEASKDSEYVKLGTNYQHIVYYVDRLGQTQAAARAADRSRGLREEADAVAKSAEVKFVFVERSASGFPCKFQFPSCSDVR